MKKTPALIRLAICLLLISTVMSACARPVTTSKPVGSNVKDTIELTDSKARAMIKTADSQARDMMRRYNLHPARGPKIAAINKSNDIMFSKLYSEPFYNASKQVGLDLSKSSDIQLSMLTYTLKEQCQSHERTIAASFLCDDKGSLTGAFLTLNGYMPGVASLKERYAFYPEGLERDRLSFKGLNRIEVFGSPGGRGRATSARLSNPGDIQRFTSLLEKSVGHKGTYEGAGMGQEEYRIFLYYKDGPQLGIWFTHRSPRDEMGINAFQRWHYYPPKELRAEVIRLLMDRRYQIQPR